MRYHKDIHKAGKTAYRASVICERPEEGPDADGVFIYGMDRDVIAQREFPNLRLAKAWAAKRVGAWEQSVPGEYVEATVDRVRYEREDIADPDYGTVAWLNDETDPDFFCQAYVNGDGDVVWQT